MTITPQTIRLEHVTVDYGEGPVIKDLDLKLEAGDLTALLGPSGCGKTTTLRVIAGLLRPSSGSVYFDGDDVTDLPPWSRRLGLVFQNHALFPHLTVLENVMYGLSRRDGSKEMRRARALELLELTHIRPMANRLPSELSGGQSQRVALARALAPEPRLLLLDEPFSSLDADLRERMRTEVGGVVREVGVTTLLVTHDQREALSMADRVVVMQGGVVMELGSPADVYDRPRSLFGAQFVGNSNVFPGSVHADNGTRELRIAGSAVPLPLSAETDDEYFVAVKPEDVLVDPSPSDCDTRLEGTLILERYEGMNHESLWSIPSLDGAIVRAVHRHGTGRRVGETGVIGWRGTDLQVVTRNPTV